MTEIHLGLSIRLGKVSVRTHVESRVDSPVLLNGLEILLNHSILTGIQTSSLRIIDGFQYSLLFVSSIVEFLKVVLQIRCVNLLVHLWTKLAWDIADELSPLFKIPIVELVV